jgi:hypothetical protein
MEGDPWMQAPRRHNNDVHAHTAALQQTITAANAELDAQGCIERMGAIDFEVLMHEIEDEFGPGMPAFANIRNLFRLGCAEGRGGGGGDVGAAARIRDPDLPGLDIARLLQGLWLKRQVWQQRNPADQSLHNHLRETFQDISTTCLQGVSHRLLVDYNSL